MSDVPAHERARGAGWRVPFVLGLACLAASGALAVRAVLLGQSWAELRAEALAAFDFVDLNGKDLAHDFEGTIGKTFAFAERLGVPVVSGSDTHQAFQYGCVTTHLDERVTTAAGLREQVLSGAYHIEYASDLAFKVKTAGMLKRSLKEINRLGGDYVQTLIAGAE